MSAAERTGEITRLLGRIRAGEPAALGEMMPIVYDELRRVARRQRRRSGSRTLDTTALVHEAYVKLSEGATPEYRDRCHFFAVAATAMRQLLVDHARAKGARKRGGDWARLDLDQVALGVEEQVDLVLSIDGALQALGQLNERLVRVVECRFFAGMSEAETGAALGVTERTVRRDWVKARAWLHRELGVS